MKAKTVSLIAKITAGAILLTGAVLKWIGVFTNCEISELCKVAGTLAALFITVDTNIALDKFKKPQEDTVVHQDQTDIEIQEGPQE